MKKNEENACNAFIEILKQIKGVTYKIVSFSEQENRATQDVEAILAPKDEEGQSPKIAVEHTIIEAHEGQNDRGPRLERRISVVFGNPG